MPSWKKVITSGSSPHFTTITSSADISSSGNVIASNIYLPGPGKISFDDSLDGTDQYISGNDNNISIDGDEFVNITADDAIRIRDGSTNVFVSIDPNAGHITASGDISSSGTITATAFRGDGSSITGVTAEWDGTHTGDAEITGSLTVVDNPTNSPLLILRNSATGTSNDVYLGYNRDNSFGSSGWSTGIDSTTNDFHIAEDADSIDNDVRMCFEAGGNIGIGTTSPGHLLEVRGTGDSLSVGDDSNTQTYARFANSRTMVGYGGSEAVLQAGSGKGLKLCVNNGTFNSGTALYISSSGTVGIGTTTPDTKLEVFEGYLKVGDSSNTGYGITLERNSATVGNINTANNRINIQASNDQDVELRDTDGNNLILKHGGNVGIGTTTPPEALTVAGNISASGTITANAFVGDGSSITGVTAEWDGTHTGNATIQGSVAITGDGSNAVTLTESGNGDFTIDANDDIRLDANGADVVYKDDSVEFGRLSNDSTDFVIKSSTNNKDIIFRGVDNTAEITALTLDMSEAGSATFNSNITASGNISASGTLYASAGDFGDGNISNVGEIFLDIVSDEATGGDTGITLTGTTLNIDVGSSTIMENTATTSKFLVPIETTSNITASGNISASGGIQAGFGTFSGTTDTVTDAAIVIPENKSIYTLDSSGQYLRKLLRKATDVIEVGQSGTSLIDEIRFLPGNAGFTTFYGDSTEVARVDIAGNITASGNISSSGTVTAGGFTTTGTWTFDTSAGGTAGITNINVGSAFTDDDVTIMSAGAIKEKIENYGYTTQAGDITGVTAGTGMSGGGTTGTVTLNNAGVTSIVATANETTVSGATGAVTIGIADDVTIPGILTADIRKFAITSNSTGDYEGDVVYFGSAEGMSAGGIWHYVMDESETGVWTEANAAAEATCDGLLAVSLGEDPDADGMLLRGMVTLDHLPGAISDTLFVSTSETEATSTAPSGNLNIVRIIGYCLDNTYGKIWFNPDNSYIEVSGG